jgi:hypothetical protein
MTEMMYMFRTIMILVIIGIVFIPWTVDMLVHKHRLKKKGFPASRKRRR